MACEHDLADREGACADGMCPICIAAEIEQLRSEMGRAAAAERERCASALILLANELMGAGTTEVSPREWRVVYALRKRADAIRKGE